MGTVRLAKRSVIVAYAGLAYAAFGAAVLYAAGFLADLGAPTTVDRGQPPGRAAIMIDVGLLLLFAVQHSVMARTGFKRRLARALPAAAERSTYVLASSLVLGLLLWQWRPLPAYAWRYDAQPWAAFTWALYLAGWLIAVSSTFMIDHLDFLGLRQACSHFTRRAYQPPPFTERWLYAWLRHPLMLGLLITFWVTPRMTAGHLLFAAAGSAYIAVGVQLEERDLRAQIGDPYRDYAQRVPALVPGRLIRRPRPASAPQSPPPPAGRTAA